MFGENETNVAKEATSEVAAKSAALEHMDELAAAAPGGPGPSSSETNVSPELAAKILTLAEDAVRQSLFAMQDSIQTAVGDYFAAHPVEQMIEQIVGPIVNDAVENAKADIIANLRLVQHKAPGSPEVEAEYKLHELAIGDPVKVWTDPERKTFFTGEIVAKHDGGHAYDVKMDNADMISKIGADGLEFDDRK